ncbi:MAG: PEP-CTERM sorting domain-containing protein [Acidobacteriota bacterium]|nr:PEP-CTERM sorting domain-containing protein [Acidobacteriota bacterium]
MALLAAEVHPDQSGASVKAPVHIVYPYSVVAGGVLTPDELRAASERDPLVALHYAGFDFRNARVIRLKHPRLVYLSYRHKEKIFWTKRQVKLCAGEQVLTDGKIVARTRCANRVSATPQAAISAEEPAAAEMERPLASGGTALGTPFPVKFESALLRQRPDWFDPADPPTSAWGYGPFAGNYYPITFPPPLPGGGGVCQPQKSKKNAELESVAQSEGSLKPKRAACTPGTPGPPPGPPATIPEPDTFILFGSGIAGIYLCHRKMGHRRGSA